MTELKLPELGENIESAAVLSVLVKPGDTIEKDQGVIEIETDKATVEVPSSLSGTIKEIFIKEGDKISVGQSILSVDDGGNGKEKKEQKAEAGRIEEVKEKSETEKDEQPKVKSVEKAMPARTAKPSAKSGIAEMKLPDLGENIESATVLTVLVKKGDTIEKDQGIMEIETDKATIEVPSSLTGKVIEVLIKEGDKAKAGQTVLKVETEAEEGVVEETRPDIKDEKKEEKKKEESEVKTEVKEEKSDGELSAIKISETKDKQPPITKDAAPAAPSVRRLAREIGVDINKVKGSGPNGRISMDDVKAYSKKLHESREGKESIGFGLKAEELPDFSKFGEVERKEMSSVRAKTAVHLSYAWATIPHVTQHDKADITELEKFRKSFSSKVEKAGGKLTVTSILVKISTEALKVFPMFNTSIDMEKKEVIYKKYFNIGVAVDTERGLIVPVIKNADKKSLTEISSELNSIAEKARNKKTSLEDLQGACFTITNLGGIGGTFFTPIVNSPETAILGVSRGSFEPVYNKDSKTFEPRLMLPLSLSYDHRIIDGADAARFLRWVCEALENPLSMLI